MDSVSDSTGWECARSSTNGRQADIRNSFAIKLRRYLGAGALPLRRAASHEIEERREDGTDDHIAEKGSAKSLSFWREEPQRGSPEGERSMSLRLWDGYL